ncbi:MAG: hypothetical protein ABEJ42_10405 [Halobacteriaceae archaeon]
MSERPGSAALVAALRDRRRHLLAAAAVAGSFAVAAAVGTPSAYYGAGLASFVVWMAWFVLTTIEWVRRADF